MDKNDEEPIDKKKNKQRKDKVMDKFVEANNPYYIQNKSRSIDIPINTMDCIRIFEKLEELKTEPENEPTLWSPLHLAKINPKEKTVVFESKPDQILKLIKGKNYERPRGARALKADASNCNIAGKWPKEIGEYARLWGLTKKGDKEAQPSMREIVMGLYFHHIKKVELQFLELKEKHPEKLGLYRNTMLKAFNVLLISLDMGEEDIDLPLTEEIYKDPNSP